MGEFLTTLVVIALFVVIGASISGWLVIRRFLRANRVVPDRRSAAPLTWMWSLSAPARLHRRLRRAVQVVSNVMAPFRPPARGRRHPASPAPLLEVSAVADALVARAAQLDDRLVAASAMAAPWRGNLLGELAWAVGEVEASVSYLERVAVAWHSEFDAAGRWPGLPPLDFRSRLGAVEAALAEVAHASADGASRAGGPVRPERLRTQPRRP